MGLDFKSVLMHFAWLELNLQVEGSPHAVDPRHALKSQRSFAKRINIHRLDAVFNCLFEYVWIGHLYKRRVDGRS